MSESLHALTQRLDRLERENRQWRRSVGVVGLLVLAFVLFGQARATPIAKVIEAARFSLVDASGRMRASLYTKNERGSPVLIFSDDAGPRRIVLGLTADCSRRLDTFDPHRPGRRIL